MHQSNSVVRSLLMCFFAFFCATGCWDQSNELGKEAIGELLAFIEARSEKGRLAGSFGDIVLYNPRTRERRFLTDDRFFDDGISFSPDGLLLAFCSARGGDRAVLRVQGVGAPLQVYFHEIQTGQINRWGNNLRQEFAELVDDVIDVQFSFDGSRIYFLSENTILGGSTASDSAWVVKRFDNERFLTGLRASPAQDVLVVKASDPGNIFLFDIAADTLHRVWESPSAILGGWSSDGQRFLVCDGNKSDKYEVMEYDLPTGSLTTVLSLENYSVWQCVYGRDSMFYAIASDSLERDDILQYDRKTGSVEWLTSNGRDKRHLAIWRPPEN